MKKTAIILGATGLTGRALLDLLISDPDFELIKLFSRRSIGVSHPKIKEFLVDLFELESESASFTGDVVFCCIGTTKSKTPNRKVYRQIDYGIPVAAAKLCRKAGIPNFIVISAIGANAQSRLFYNRTKGEMERDVLKEQIPNTFILQPGLLVGKRDEKRPGEAFASGFFGLINPILPLRYRSISAESVAQTMWLLSKQTGGSRVMDQKEMWALLKKCE